MYPLAAIAHTTSTSIRNTSTPTSASALRISVRVGPIEASIPKPRRARPPMPGTAPAGGIPTSMMDLALCPTRPALAGRIIYRASTSTLTPTGDDRR